MNKKIEVIAKRKKEAPTGVGIMAESNGKIITRKEAVKKVSYLAVSAAMMMILLNTAKAQGSSPVTVPADEPASLPNKNIW